MAIGVVAAAAAAAALAGLGRWEKHRWVEGEAAGIAAVLDAVGPLADRTLSGFRTLEEFECLAYRRGSNPVALELCVDAEGRVVEAFDRRGGDRRIWSLRAEPDSSPVTVSRAEVEVLVSRLQREGG